MRNLLIYIMLMMSALLTPGVCLLTSCHLAVDSSQENIFELCLPPWPPQDPSELAQNYPELSRWQVTITGAEAQYTFYTSQAAVPVHTRKNRPVSVVARPITRLENGSESAYFQPAGYIHPFSKKTVLSWEQGYLALIMQMTICSGQEEGLAPVEIEYLVSTFNWKKAQENLDKKENPWLLAPGPVVQAICSHSFKASMLNPSGTITLENPAPKAIPQLLSSYIPENISLYQKNQFTVLKNSPIIIGDGSKYAFFITCKSAKNISHEFIYMPIYIEDI